MLVFSHPWNQYFTASLFRLKAGQKIIEKLDSLDFDIAQCSTIQVYNDIYALSEGEMRIQRYSKVTTGKAEEIKNF